MTTIDFETRSRVDLKTLGAYRYATDPSTEVLCVSWDGGSWRNGEPAPRDLFDRLSRGDIVAHNAAFERLIWRYVCVKRMGWPPLREDAVVDTLAACAYKAIPQALDAAAKVLELSEQKSDTGKALIQKYCKPISAGKLKGDFRPCVGEQLAQMSAYCDQDVATEEALDARIGRLPADEYRVWQLDQRINDRGIGIDLPGVQSALAVCQLEADRVTAEITALTGGAVTSVGQVAKLKEWLALQGEDVEDLRKDTVDALLADPTSDHVQQALSLRKAGSMASVKKLLKMQNCVCPDGRAHGLLQYHGASTGRWAGRLIQPQNFPRPTVKVDADLLTTGTPAEVRDLLEIMYGCPVTAISSALRSLIVPAKGKLLCAGDFSSIEARVNAVLAGEQWKVDLFRSGGDAYLTAAEAIFGYPCTKKGNPEERQVGKVAELACGYQGSVGAFATMGRNYGITLPEDRVKEIVKAWRRKHQAIVASWAGYEIAATAAVVTGQPHDYGMVQFGIEGDWLYCLLPSGRKLWYFKPTVAEGPYGDPVPAYWAQKQLKGGGRKWMLVNSYGGLLCENIVQAVSRDLMVHAMFTAEANGFPVVLTVHDELVTEPDAANADPRALEQIMNRAPTWAAGWPVSSEAWAGTRYGKG